ncbi:MAG: tetratricopeptide repeat protein [Proteobacteria bacterium]|nr:tetratricopeptide repeat protein [Pseudomonadota bacterium]MBU1648837.1 tetratricopeptide repeat protein [Pseudomonadota bacterium]
MIHHFPLFSAAHSLSHHDFHNFFLPFSRVIKEKITTATEVSFLEDACQLDNVSDDVSRSSLLKEIFAQTLETKVPAAYDNCLFFPFSIADEQIIVAFVTGIDRLLVKKAGHDWLQEVRDTLQREFLILKQAGVDLQTGLLNGAHLNTLFDTSPEGEHVGLVLVEIYPKARTAMEGMRHVRRSATVLKSFAGEHIPLYHIGQSVFAFACRNCNEDSAARFGPLLVSFLKQEQFKRVHVGYSQGELSQNSHNETRKTGRQILDEAWLALQVACKRGPFSFCTYRSLQNSQRHSLYASTRDILARIQPFWQKLDQFSLVQLHPAKGSDNIFDKITLDLVGSKKFKGKDRDVYILLPNIDSRRVLPLVKKIIQSITRDIKNNVNIAAGIATFPFSDFKKPELILNCRKALLHGALLGEGTITVFEALSLNVSGDIFYGEGDIPKAVKEYRRGLLIQPNDVNLLNSLGVSYAMMNRHSMANDCFIKALTVKNDDFMSWYNLGLGRELQGNIAGAVESFEHAVKYHIEDEPDTANVRKELPLQLGKLYCQTGRYQETLDILLPWYYNTEKNDLGSGRALRYLGESCHGVGRVREAMSWLQRAIRFDEFDADALSLLGEIYLDNNEGDQIALKLCEKSVELNPIPALFHLRLARAQVQCDYLEAARETLRHCLRNKETKKAAGFQMGLTYWKQRQKKRAKHWFSKILTHEEIGSNQHKQASSYLLELQTQ